MQPAVELWRRFEAFLTSGIAGSEFTPLRLLIVITLLSALVWTTRRITRWLIDRVLARRGVEVGMREALGAIVRYVVISLGAVVILQSAGIDLTSLNVLVGAIGVGLGFGLQNITNNFFSGLVLLFERPIKINDRVEIAGCVGEVSEIAARATTLVTDENVAIIVPNSQFVSERVTNWSRPGELTAYVIPFYVSHTTDPELVRQLLLAAAEGHRDVLHDPAPEVEFIEAGLGALRFQLQVWSREHLKTAGALKSDLNFAAWRQLTAAGLTIPPAQGAIALGVQLAQSPARRRDYSTWSYWQTRLNPDAGLEDDSRLHAGVRPKPQIARYTRDAIDPHRIPVLYHSGAVNFPQSRPLRQTTFESARRLAEPAQDAVG